MKKTLNEINERLAEIRSQVESDSVENYESIQREIKELEEARNELNANAETRSKILKNIAAGEETRTVSKHVVEQPEERYTAESPEYRTAWLKYMNNEEDKWTETEKRAFTHTTENTSAVVPKELVDKIYSTMAESHPLLADVTKLHTTAAISIVKHTAIVAGDAAEVAEGVANADEKNTFINVDIALKDFSKHLEFSYRLGKMAISSFESYLIQELSSRLAKVRTEAILETILEDSTRGLAASQKVSTADSTLEGGDILATLGILKDVNQVNLYMTRKTFYQSVAVMSDPNIISYVRDFQTQIPANVFGYPVKFEDAMEDGQILFLDPSQYTDNVVQDIMIERDRDIKRHVHIVSGLVIAGGTLTNDLAGALLTVTADELP